MPPHRVAEVVDGVLHTNPAMRHAHASSSLGTKISGRRKSPRPE